MDLNFNSRPEEEAFRAEVRAFLNDKLPARLSEKVRSGKRLTKADRKSGTPSSTSAAGWPTTGPSNTAARAGTRCRSSSSTTSARWPCARASCPSA
jgi:hypothetical protein